MVNEEMGAVSTDLTREYEAFAQGIAYGFTPSMAAENAGLELTQIEAKHLSLSPEISTRVGVLVHSQSFDPSNEHIRIAAQLEIDRDFAYRMGNPAAAINATVQRARVLGVMVDRIDTNARVAVASPDQLTPDEWAAKFGVDAAGHTGSMQTKGGTVVGAGTRGVDLGSEDDE